MAATIRAGYAAPLVTGPTPAAGITAPVTLGAAVAATMTAVITAPVNVSPAGLTGRVRVAYAGPLLTDVPYAAAIQAPVTLGATLTGGPSGGVIRVAYAAPLQAVQNTLYWSGTQWVAGTTAAFITAPVALSAPGFTAAPAAAIRAPVAVSAGAGVKRDITITVALDPDHYTATVEDSPYTITLEDTVPRTIRTSIGDSAYVSVVVTETTGKDITGSTFQISMGTPNGPGTWLTPAIIETLTPSQMRLKLLVGPAGTTVTAGAYRAWGRIIDNPETESLMAGDRVSVV